MALILMKSIFQKIKNNFKDISISKTFSGEGVIINNDQAKGIIFKGVNNGKKNTRISRKKYR